MMHRRPVKKLREIFLILLHPVTFGNALDLKDQEVKPGFLVDEGNDLHVVFAFLDFFPSYIIKLVGADQVAVTDKQDFTCRVGNDFDAFEKGIPQVQAVTFDGGLSECRRTDSEA